MDLILKQDVDNLGFKDDIVSVKNGYGRNYLIPQGYAIMATPSAKKMLEENLRQRSYKDKELIENAKKMAEQLENLDVKIPAKSTSGAMAGDKIFGSVTTTDLADALNKEGHTIEKKYININGGNVKRLGLYQAVIRLHRDVTVELPFEVVPES